MKIRSKLTGLEQTVTAEGWEKMKGRGDAKKFIIISKDATAVEAPADTNAANYNAIVKSATKAFKAKKWQEAKKLYEQAAAINKTTLITDKLAEIETYLDFKE